MFRLRVRTLSRRCVTCRITVLAVMLGAVVWCGTATADDSPWGGAIGIASDNVYRGLSLSAGQPAWLADIHRTVGRNWVMGLSASATRPASDGAAAELVLYAEHGWQWTTDWSFTVGVMHHEFPWDTWRDKARYDEVSLGLSWQGRAHFTLITSPNSAGYRPRRHSERGTATWLELSLEQPLHGRVGANLGIGRAQFASEGSRDYNYASAGLRYGMDHAYWYLSYLWSDLDGYYYRHNSISGSGWVFSAVWMFP